MSIKGDGVPGGSGIVDGYKKNGRMGLCCEQ